MIKTPSGGSFPKYSDASRKESFVWLDAIRGICALLVVARHYEWLLGSWFFRSHLAVDVFFVLSGFVIAHAYEGKLLSGKLSFSGFLKTRLIRLYPIYALAIGVAAVGLLLKQSNTNALASDAWAAALLALAFIPAHLTGSTALFPINHPTWSLAQELVWNSIYGALVKHISNRRLLVFIGVASTMLAAGTYVKGDVDFGSTWKATSIAGGFIRAGNGLALGLLLRRNFDALESLTFWRAMTQFRWTPWVCMALIAGLLMSPDLGAFNGLVDMLAVTMIIPTLIAGAASRHETRAAPLLRFAGQSSYPLYALHMPLMSVAFGVSASMGKALSAEQGWLIIATAFIACGWIESKIDTPIRRHISAWLQPKVASPQQNG